MPFGLLLTLSCIIFLNLQKTLTDKKLDVLKAMKCLEFRSGNMNFCKYNLQKPSNNEQH